MLFVCVLLVINPRFPMRGADIYPGSFIHQLEDHAFPGAGSTRTGVGDPDATACFQSYRPHVGKATHRMRCNWKRTTILITSRGSDGKEEAAEDAQRINPRSMGKRLRV